MQFLMTEPCDAALLRQINKVKGEILEDIEAAKRSGAWIETIKID